MQRKKDPSISSSGFIRKSLGFTAVIDDSLASTERSLAMLDNIEKVGTQTQDTLEQQSEQLRRVQGEMDEVVVNEKKAKRLISSIRSLWGTFINLFRNEPHKEDNITATDKIIKKQKIKNKKNIKSKKSKKEKEVRDILREETIVDLSVLSKENKNNNLKVNDNIEKIGQKVCVAEKLARKMGEELDEQNIRLDKINETTHGATEAMRSLQGRIGRM